MTVATMEETGTVTLTETAASKLAGIMNEKGLAETHGLRVFVSGGGCSGLQYGMTFDANPKSVDLVLEQHGLRVIIDPQSLRYMEGASIDYVEGPAGGGFHIDNPKRGLHLQRRRMQQLSVTGEERKMRPVTRYDLNKVGEYVYEVPQAFRHDMRVPAHFYADEDILEKALEDRSLEQLVNTATLPGVVSPALAMPDIHQGYGFPIGGVVATRLPSGVISPGGVGYDINCGVRLLATHLDAAELRPHLDRLADALYRCVPSGVGVKGNLHLNKAELDHILADGSRWALKEGFARKEDVAHTEEGGRMTGADPAKVSIEAKKRGIDQVGTLGSGNHFAEIDVITEIRHPEAADAFGLRLGQAVVQIHCGSRGLGHQVATDYIQTFQSASRKFGYDLPDKQLVCAPLDSPEGQAYLAAMNCAANYAWANRQVLTYRVREAFEEVLGGKVPNWDLFLVYDVAHNMAKVELHKVGGQEIKLCVHRKGATRAFEPGHPDVPGDYRAVGQPVLVPGSMGTASFVLVGAARAAEHTFGSCCHGAGRVMSRSDAKRQVRGEQLRNELEHDGIAVRAGSLAGLAEEAPQAYKDVDRVVAIVEAAGLARIVARLEPLAVIKG